MPTFQQFPLPDAGEGLTEAEIVAWHVAVGDTVAVSSGDSARRSTTSMLVPSAAAVSAAFSAVWTVGP